MENYRKAKKTIDVSVGESVRIMRELQELSQSDLAALTGIPQPTISGIENDRINIGVERAKVLARALKCHPAVLVFPGWSNSREFQGIPGTPYLIIDKRNTWGSGFPYCRYFKCSLQFTVEKIRGKRLDTGFHGN